MRERGVATFLPNLPGDWQKVPLAARLAEALDAPAALINDARAFALAESALGAARDCDTAVFVAVGTGVGGGITVGGRLHEGRAGRAGEIGHVTIAEKGPQCTCGNRGCLEAFVREALGARRLRRAGQLLGIGVANAIVLLAPELRRDRRRRRLHRREAARRPLRQEVARRVFVSVPVEIVQAELGVRAGASARRYAAPAAASAAFRALKSSRIVSVAVAPIRVTPTFITSSSASSVRTPPAALT